MYRSAGIVKDVVAPKTPYGASNWPWIDDGDGANLAAPTLDLPDSPWVISTVLAWPAMIAAAACLTCSRNDVPPTPVPSIQRGTMPSEWATWTGPGELTVAIPSMSLVVRPTSASVFSAASVCSCNAEWPGSLPTRSVSAAPAMITPLMV